MSQRAEGPPTSNVMEVSTYSQVVFNEVPQSYVPNNPVKCCYRVTAAIEPHRRDWVGIFKVGWSTTRDYYTFVWAAPCSNPVGEEPVEQHVIFDAYYLPKEDGEFYQFCFVDSSGQVRGASIPFRFESPVESSLDYSIENDLLVITTQEQVEKDKEELHKEMEKQKETNEILRAELEERLLEIKCLKESNVELGQCVSRLEQQQAQRAKETEEERKQWASQQEIEGAHQQRERQELQQNASTWQDNYQQAMTKINQLEQEQAELKEKIATQEAEIQQLSSSIREMEQERQQNLDKLQTQDDHIILLKVDLQSSQKETVKLAGELRSLRAELAEGLHENQAQKILSEQNGKDEEDIEKQNQLMDIQKILDEQVNLATVMRGEKEALSRENQELKITIEKLSEELAQLKALPTPSHVTIGTQNPEADPLLYGKTFETPAASSTEEKLMVCRYCQEIFPGIRQAELQQHEESHKVCPFCTLICDSMDQHEFEEHVYSHE